MNGIEEQLTDILAKCTTLPNYKVIVIFKRASRRDEFLSEMKNVSNDNPWCVDISERRIRFINGSEIEVILDNSSIYRGRRANLVVLDEDIGDDFEDFIFNYIIVPYNATQKLLESYLIEPSDDNNQVDPITEFLNEFTIKQ